MKCEGVRQALRPAPAPNQAGLRQSAQEGGRARRGGRRALCRHGRDTRDLSKGPGLGLTSPFCRITARPEPRRLLGPVGCASVSPHPSTSRGGLATRWASTPHAGGTSSARLCQWPSAPAQDAVSVPAPTAGRTASGQECVLSRPEGLGPHALGYARPRATRTELRAEAARTPGLEPPQLLYI